MSVKILLTGRKGIGRTTLISSCDVDRVTRYGWYVNENGYALARVNNKLTRLHRFILGYTGPLDIDHINGDRLDNTRENLRVCTRSENLWNMHNKKGYYWDKSRKKWHVHIGHKSFGQFDDEGEAYSFARAIYEEIQHEI